MHAGIPHHLPPEQTLPRSRHPPRADTPRTKHPLPLLCAVHAGRYGQQAGGMHPTGMQSFLPYLLTDLFLTEVDLNYRCYRIG